MMKSLPIFVFSILSTPRLGICQRLIYAILFMQQQNSVSQLFTLTFNVSLLSKSVMLLFPHYGSCLWASHNALLWKSQTHSVNDSIKDFDQVFQEIPLKNCIVVMLLTCPIGNAMSHAGQHGNDTTDCGHKSIFKEIFIIGRKIHMIVFLRGLISW